MLLNIDLLNKLRAQGGYMLPMFSCPNMETISQNRPFGPSRDQNCPKNGPYAPMPLSLYYQNIGKHRLTQGRKA